jgi:hypothetical protein
MAVAYSSTDTAIIFPPKEPRILQRESRHRSGSHLCRFSSQGSSFFKSKELAFGIWVHVFWLHGLSIEILCGCQQVLIRRGETHFSILSWKGFDSEECSRLSSLRLCSICACPRSDVRSYPRGVDLAERALGDGWGGQGVRGFGIDEFLVFEMDLL